MATPRPSVGQYFQIESADIVSYADADKKLQEGLQTAATSYVAQLEKNAKEIKLMYDEVDQALGEFTSGQSKMELNNPAVDWDDTWRDAKTEYANLNRKIVAGVGTADDRKRISQLDAMVNSTTDNIANVTLLAQSAAEARKNPGKMGGIDMGSNSRDTLLAMEILNGNTKGSKKLVTNLNTNPPTQAWEVYDDKGQLIWTRSTGDIEQMLEKGGSGGVTTIPAETQTMENNVASLKNVETGEINNDFYKLDSNNRPEVKTRVITLPDGSKKIESYNELDMAKIRASIGSNIRAGSGALSDSDKEGAIALYNSVLGPGQRDPQTGKEIPFDPIEATNFVWDEATKKKYNDAYVNYNLNNFLQKDRQVKLEAYSESSSKTSSGSKKGTGGSPRLKEIKTGMVDLINKLTDKSAYDEKGILKGDIGVVSIQPEEVVELFEKYGVKVQTRQQLVEDGIKDLEDSKLFFVNKTGNILPAISFDNQQNIKGVIEAYRDYLVQTSAGQTEIKAWENMTKEFYNRADLP